MKADIVNHFTGQTILAVPGVTSLQHLEAALRDLIPLGVRHVTTCFDMDYLKNWHVENAYFGIGTNKLREITSNPDCGFVIWIGTKRLIKRKKFEKYLEDVDTL